MPLLQPEIQRALRAAGLKKGSEENPEGSFEDKLEAAGLGTSDVLSAVSRIMNNADNESTQLRAAEIVLKAKGLLKEQTPPPPSVIINIQGKEGMPMINPILLPRSSQVQALPNLEQKAN